MGSSKSFRALFVTSCLVFTTAGALAQGCVAAHSNQRVISQLVTSDGGRPSSLWSIHNLTLNLGYRVFVVADACWAAEKRDLAGRLWSAEDVHALSLANMHGEYAQVVDSAMTLQAAAWANARRRMKAR